MRNQTLKFMQANFGKAGAYYYWISRGIRPWWNVPGKITHPVLILRAGCCSADPTPGQAYDLKPSGS
jgi:hypothetical protein